MTSSDHGQRTCYFPHAHVSRACDGGDGTNALRLASWLPSLQTRWWNSRRLLPRAGHVLRRSVAPARQQYELLLQPYDVLLLLQPSCAFRLPACDGLLLPRACAFPLLRARRARQRFLSCLTSSPQPLSALTGAWPSLQPASSPSLQLRAALPESSPALPRDDDAPLPPLRPSCAPPLPLPCGRLLPLPDARPRDAPAPGARAPAPRALRASRRYASCALQQRQ